MTTAGLAGLLICQSELWESRRSRGGSGNDTREAVRDAFAWMQVALRREPEPRGADRAWWYYYLYGLERAGILGRVRFIGAHDWYREGADLLWTPRRTTARGAWATWWTPASRSCSSSARPSGPGTPPSPPRAAPSADYCPGSARWASAPPRGSRAPATAG